jgi:primosomal protein N' (replication factor Y)
LSKGDWEGFYTYELQQRQRAQMPPFGRLAGLIVSGEDREAALAYGRSMIQALPQGVQVRVLGPVEAPLAVLRGRYRFRMLVWSERSFAISSFLRHWLGLCPPPRGSVRLQVDVDPVSFV